MYILYIWSINFTHITRVHVVHVPKKAIHKFLSNGQNTCVHYYTVYVNKKSPYSIVITHCHTTVVQQ